ncbi:phospholipid-translocating ATPase [Dendrothele bispora CBS 962.96]|uniref:Phospholipid-transporting ATPase n=1 Tax=Dendrothele bispora (strain CBS 962.96) TaxID=1314807 RepID=A0A4S8KQX7_DENBC|nr:phospholipid-translocating ATPase [Dendrothele bispora CBS 962.96]
MTSKESNRFAVWHKRLAALNVDTLFGKKQAVGPRRTVFVNQDLPENYFDSKGRVKKEHVYSTNQVVTSKYTIITFLPRNLLEQFRRVANFFFLTIAVLQFFNIFSTVSPGVAILPLLLVLAATAFKDGSEDVKRHRSDREVNYTMTRVLDGGDFINLNGMKPKSKTFARGLVPKRFKASNVIKGGDSAAPQTDIETAETRSKSKSPELSLSGFPLEFELDDDNGGEFPPSDRHGHESNGKPTQPHWKRIIWEDVRVGDIVKIMDNEPFPADILICATSEEDNVAFVETKNLDGETNLKSRTAVAALTHLRTAGECAKRENAFSVDLDRPDNNMFKLNATSGNLKNSDRVSADIGNILLRGTVLRNTGWVVGVVLFTGEDTKILLNSGATPSKRSKVERQMNIQVMLNLLLLAGMAITCGVISFVNADRDTPRGALWLYGANPSSEGVITFFFALITFQSIVPISLYISIEVVRTCQALFIYFDSEIFDEKSGRPTLANSWTLSDDLGQIEYIFSDKTGTLTQNKMIFRQCSIGGKVFTSVPETDSPETQLGLDDNATSPVTTNADDSALPASRKTPIFHSPELSSDLKVISSSSSLSPDAALHAQVLTKFFLVLALCHTVLTSTNSETGELEYKAQSPDEEALVRAAADVGYVFRGREREFLSVETPSRHLGKSEKYELLNVLEFTSARRRMSVVVRKLGRDNEEDGIFLFMKGADNVVFERLEKGVDGPLKEQTEKDLSEFASSGLRTLTLAYKVLSKEEYEEWNERYHEATVAIEDREEKIDRVSDELEQGLRLLGATAIEDSLQDGVPETIADLKRAGIKIWVATGDKLETAIAIGHSTNLINRDSNIVIIRGGSENSRPVQDQIVAAIQEFFPDCGLDNKHTSTRPSLHRRSVSSVPASSHNVNSSLQLRRTETGIASIVGSDNGDRPGGFVLVIEGNALGNALNEEKTKDLLLKLAMLCEGVICCRVSPLQKALVLKMVKNGLGVMTLAIGDGANDVSMIQAADVGVGISGEEGLQAANSSDYAIAQFRFLKRLILVHGHWSYARNGNMILNFFYKNVVIVGTLWWFQIYDGWSSVYAIDYIYILLWNAVWTLFPVVAIGLFDRIVDDHVLMDLPELYRYGREGRWFGLKRFLVYMTEGMYQSAVIFFIVFYTYAPTPTSREDGYNHYIYEFTTIMLFACVISTNLSNGLDVNFWSVWVFFAILYGSILIWIFTAIYNAFSPTTLSTRVYGNNYLLFRSAYFWLCLLLVVILAILPRYLSKAWKFGFAPGDIDIMRWQVKIDPHNKNYAQYAFLENEGLQHRVQEKSSGHELPEAISHNASRVAPMSEPSLGRHPNQSAVSVRSASQMDMANGTRSTNLGFSFSTEDSGHAIQRIQSTLSERRLKGTQRSGLGQRKRKMSESAGAAKLLSVFKKS